MATAADPILTRFRTALDKAYGARIERVVFFSSRAGRCPDAADARGAARRHRPVKEEASLYLEKARGHLARQMSTARTITCPWGPA